MLRFLERWYKEGSGGLMTNGGGLAYRLLSKISTRRHYIFSLGHLEQFARVTPSFCRRGFVDLTTGRTAFHCSSANDYRKRMYRRKEVNCGRGHLTLSFPDSWVLNLADIET
jgi:hypothetical protein